MKPALAALALLVAYLVSSIDHARSPSASVRGVGLGLFASDPEWDYGAMIRELRARGATDVLLVVQLSQTDRFASDLQLLPGDAPSHATLVRTMRQARAQGLRVGLMPIVHLRQRDAHEWRGTLVPADGLPTWFARYGEHVLALATLAEREQVHRFVVGSELSSLEPYDDRWRALIAETRSRFRGTLTYSANWDRLNAVSFWDALDEVGLTGYFPLAAPGEAPTARSLREAWRAPREALRRLRAREARPIVLLEVGYPSRSTGAARPWDDGEVGPSGLPQRPRLDLAQQTLLLDAFCDAFADQGVIDGFYAWNWFGVGGPRDTGFTLRGKPASRSLEACFGRAWKE